MTISSPLKEFVCIKISLCVLLPSGSTTVLEESPSSAPFTWKLSKLSPLQSQEKSSNPTKFFFKEDLGQTE